MEMGAEVAAAAERDAAESSATVAMIPAALLVICLIVSPFSTCQCRGPRRDRISFDVTCPGNVSLET